MGLQQAVQRAWSLISRLGRARRGPFRRARIYLSPF